MNKSNRLADFRGRDNNFNLIRFVAALLVIWGHAFDVQGQLASEPLNQVFGITSGNIGVNVFFLTSGYLVTKSWDSKSWREFAWARGKRIFPAMWVSTSARSGTSIPNLISRSGRVRLSFACICFSRSSE